MVFCVSTDLSTYNQCTAAALCNQSSGWTLCKASIYRQQFNTTAPPALDAWIAGCIRNGGAVTAPTDTVCTNCVGTFQQPGITGAWSCTGGSPQYVSNYLYIGIKTSDTCQRVGTKLSDPAYWYPQSSQTTFQRAVCCK